MAKHPAKVETKIEIEKEEIEVQTITLTKEQEIKKAGLSIKIENLTDSDKEWIWRKQQSL